MINVVAVLSLCSRGDVGMALVGDPVGDRGMILCDFEPGERGMDTGLAGAAGSESVLSGLSGMDSGISGITLGPANGGAALVGDWISLLSAGVGESGFASEG